MIHGSAAAQARTILAEHRQTQPMATATI